MRRIENLIRCQSADSGVAFRETVYGPEEDDALLRDVIAMTNADMQGPRLIFMGIRDGTGGERKVIGLEPDALSRAAHYRRLVSAFIDPPLAVDVRRAQVDGVSVGILMISHCDDPPYLMKQDFSSELRKGQGWIRSGKEQTRLTRIPLQRIFQRKFAGGVSPDIQVAFLSSEPCEEITLPVLALTQMPSEVAISRIKRLLNAKEHANRVLGHEDSRIDRLLHAQLFGTEAQYKSQSADTLEIRLANARRDHTAADRYYEFELRAHKINLVLRNVSDTPVENAALTLCLPRTEGLGVSDRLYSAPGADAKTQTGYATVQTNNQSIEIQANVQRVAGNTSVEVFRQPLRLLLREAVTGRTIPLLYTLHAKNLREPIAGELRIRAIASDVAQAERRLHLCNPSAADNG